MLEHATSRVRWWGEPGQRVKMVHLTSDRPTKGTFFLFPGKASPMGLRSWLMQRILDQGWEVYSLDWREQGESERYFSAPGQIDVGPNAFEDYVQDALALIDWARASGSPRPWVLFGSSLGGHIGIRVLEEHCLFDGALLQAPLCEPMMPLPLWMARPLVKMLDWCGASHAVAPGQATASPFAGYCRQAATCEYAKETVQYYEQFPENLAWQVTIGWVRALLDSCTLAMEPTRIQRIQCPTVVVIATEDTVVSPVASRSFARLLPNARVVELDCGHNISRHSKEVRESALNVTLQFLEQLYAQCHPTAQPPLLDAIQTPVQGSW